MIYLSSELDARGIAGEDLGVLGIRGISQPVAAFSRMWRLDLNRCHDPAGSKFYMLDSVGTVLLDVRYGALPTRRLNDLAIRPQADRRSFALGLHQTGKSRRARTGRSRPWEVIQP